MSLAKEEKFTTQNLKNERLCCTVPAAVRLFLDESLLLSMRFCIFAIFHDRNDAISLNKAPISISDAGKMQETILHQRRYGQLFRPSQRLNEQACWMVVFAS